METSNYAEYIVITGYIRQFKRNMMIFTNIVEICHFYLYPQNLISELSNIDINTMSSYLHYPWIYGISISPKCMLSINRYQYNPESLSLIKMINHCYHQFTHKEQNQSIILYGKSASGKVS